MFRSTEDGSGISAEPRRQCLKIGLVSQGSGVLDAAMDGVTKTTTPQRWDHWHGHESSAKCGLQESPWKT